MSTPVLRAAMQLRHQSEGTKRAARQEDQEEVERERKLREAFASRVQGHFNQKQQQQQHSSQGPQGDQPNDFRQLRLARFAFFLVSIYLIMMLASMRDPNSIVNTLSGVPWWQASFDTSILVVLLRMLVPSPKQKELKSAFESYQKRFPEMTFAQYIQSYEPFLLNGRRVQQVELLWALNACFAATQDLELMRVVNRAIAENRGDPQAAVDAIVDGLRQDYPHVFAPHSLPPPAPANTVSM
jgi:hypothetical protein